MSTGKLNQHSTESERELSYHQFLLESGRGDALELIFEGKSKQTVLDKLIQSIESIFTSWHFCVMAIAPDKQSLVPLSAPHVAEDYLRTASNIDISANAGACGEAAFHRNPVYIANLSAHAAWANVNTPLPYETHWAYPIISPDNTLVGTLAILNNEQREPTPQEHALFTYETRTIAMIIERFNNVHRLKKLNAELEQRVNERTAELLESNQLLEKALLQRNTAQTQLIEKEFEVSLHSMLTSLTHEMNTPIGVSVTANSHLQSRVKDINSAFSKGTLSKSLLEQFMSEARESTDIVDRNLGRAAKLITTFKQLSFDQYSDETRPILLVSFVDELLLSINTKLHTHPFTLCIDIDSTLCIETKPAALGQLLFNLILNAIQHGFTPPQQGHIWIRARQERNTLVLSVKDDGCGMNEDTINRMYKPFFTLARQEAGLGLGLHICYNIVSKVLKGEIECISEPNKGAEFLITLPLLSGKKRIPF
ncbi:GAF domain-containing sensor histidine kinase [Aestuariibacter sp. AA17]|uniref:histidine kinase n=1 Tax=Fluctibacter corallii TaxID=2984329 RepID=A0ABT3A4F6_9ALTE|nr:GAF domain-containing sensor histidine kinase [Aestuariibacter sp. AA17]MCV2883483.1 GAF domain-containing sensor histidine kinase [Aestuariibacter sp. AA17]